MGLNFQKQNSSAEVSCFNKVGYVWSFLEDWTYMTHTGERCSTQ